MVLGIMVEVEGRCILWLIDLPLGKEHDDVALFLIGYDKNLGNMGSHPQHLPSRPNSLKTKGSTLYCSSCKATYGCPAVLDCAESHSV